MSADISSGSIFWLLPLNVLFMAISIFNIEHVAIFVIRVSNSNRCSVLNDNFSYSLSLTL